MAQILTFNLETEKLTRIRMLAMRLGIFTRTVKPEDFGRTLAVLTGREKPDGSRQPVLPFSGEMLVIDGLEPEQFHGLLDGMRNVGARVALKAVITEQNLQWTPARLYRELAAEHEAIRRGRKTPDQKV